MWERMIGPDAYEVPRFCEVLTEHVRSVKEGPLDTDRIKEDQGFLAKLSAPYEPPSTSHDPEINQKKYSPSPLSTPNLHELKRDCKWMWLVDVQLTVPKQCGAIESGLVEVMKDCRRNTRIE